MARFETDGIDELAAQLHNLGAALENEIGDAMLMAGAEKVRQAWRQSAIMHRHKRYGYLIDAIGYARKPKKVRDVKSIDIYPQGYDKDGRRNAMKAFVLHYGTKKKDGSVRIPGSRWIDDADRICDSTVLPEMERVYNEELKKRGLG